MRNDKLQVHISAIFSFICLAVLLIRSATAQYQPTDYLVSYCSEYRHYDQGSAFQSNLYLMSSNFSGKANVTKFDSFTTGKTPNKIYGIFLCNSLLNNQICQDCVATAVTEIQQRCQFSKEYMVWYVGCMLRYADHPILSINDDSIYYNLMFPPVNYGQFNQTLSKTFTSLFRNATSGDSSSASASAVTEVERNVSVDAYVECTPDLSPSNCTKCLQTALGRMPMIGTRTGILLQPNCQLLYVFNDTRSNDTKLSTTRPTKERHVALGVISAVAAASVLLNIFAMVTRTRRNPIFKPTGLDEIEKMENLQFEFEAIKGATDNFSPSNKLGQGGFGIVYMGELADGQAIAVKRLSNASGQGIREFKTEACLAAKLQHKNLVKVYGFCLEQEEMLLVYEFVANKSLDRYLFDEKRASFFKWATRYKIIVGIARGLLYLHEDSHPKIIHRDLKPSNILLDGNMNPKIADFGMAKLFAGDQTQGNTSRVAGTFGYMAPEYVATGHFSVKSDIFSYGVILLELVSGKRNTSFDPVAENENLLNYAWRLWNEGSHLELADSALGRDFSKEEVERCIHFGLLCIQEDPAKRPNIGSALLLLNSQPITIPRPAAPPAFPYKQDRPALSYRSWGAQADGVISDLSAR